MPSILQLFKKYQLSIIAFLLTAFFLSMVQMKIDRPIIILERFIEHGGWIEILIMAIYAGLITNKMMDPAKTAKWRKITWTVFSIVFFGQLALGLLGFDKFLMTGKLHLPVPLMIISGPLFRGTLSFMPILFLSTLLVSGPAWCSQLCYFGALDNLAAGRKKSLKPVQDKFKIKNIFILLIIATTLILRFFGVSTKITTLIALGFGITGMLIILFLSARRGKMMHCILWCPVGTLVSYMKHISPFRMYINSSCTDCMSCTRHCNYDALTKKDVQKRVPGLTCTLCGDCLPSCKSDSIKYKFFNLDSSRARNTWIVLTISLHAIFLALGRI